MGCRNGTGTLFARMMRSGILGAALLGVAALPSYAESDLTLTGNAALLTQYVDRGLTNSAEKPAVQPEFGTLAHDFKSSPQSRSFRERLELGAHRNVSPSGGTKVLRRGFQVEVEHDHIVVRVTGTSYAASYYRMDNSTGLVARNLPLRDDHRAPMSRLEFIKSSWELAKAKAQQLNWI
jgi:Bacterial protein of unknown function (Gcw_chp)